MKSCKSITETLSEDFKWKVLPLLVLPVSYILLYFLCRLISIVLIADENFTVSIRFRKSNSKAEVNQFHPALHGFAAAVSISSMQLALLRSNLAMAYCINHVFVISSRIFFSECLSTNSAMPFYPFNFVFLVVASNSVYDLISRCRRKAATFM